MTAKGLCSVSLHDLRTLLAPMKALFASKAKRTQQDCAPQTTKDPAFTHYPDTGADKDGVYGFTVATAGDTARGSGLSGWSLTKPITFPGPDVHAIAVADLAHHLLRQRVGDAIDECHLFQ